MATPLTPDELTAILEALGAGDISQEEAARRAHILDTEPGKYHCGTCQFYKVGECHFPHWPVQALHRLTVRCGEYLYDDPRRSALPPTPARSGSRMFK